MNWNYDQMKLVLADQPELERLVQAVRRWEIRNLEEPLEPPSPDEWNARVVHAANRKAHRRSPACERRAPRKATEAGHRQGGHQKGHACSECFDRGSNAREFIADCAGKRKMAFLDCASLHCSPGKQN
jgi:hypothetical protein